jgi:DNA-binding transcriptional MerR regulator
MMNAELTRDDGNAVFTVTQLCREFDVTPRALRFYESKGLLHPSRQDTRRRFGNRDRARLALILRGKRFGFSLAEIGELLDLYDTGDSQVTQLTRTIETAEQRLDEMRRQREELDVGIVELQEQLDVVRNILAEKKDEG